MSQNLSPKRRISVWDLRRLFNEGGYQRMMIRQELTARSVRCKEVDPNSPMIGRNTPVGSVSQTIHLYNNQNDLVVEFHRFITPEGKIGASKLNDPKKML